MKTMQTLQANSRLQNSRLIKKYWRIISVVAILKDFGGALIACTVRNVKEAWKIMKLPSRKCLRTDNLMTV